jgi:alpha-tubulin suppressor-like RCC1 family protein
MACVALASPTLRALHATFNTAADIPLTVPSYTATGEATFTLGFVPTPGTNLTVVKNTGLPFITGQFSNLANGATVNLTHDGTTYPFIAWYYGGVGNNDLVLLWPYTGLATWGNNDDGQLGDGSTTNRNAPVDVADRGVLRGKTIVQVARGHTHSLALCSDGTVAGWGRNLAGEVGDNTTTPRLEPVAVLKASSALAGKTVIAVAAGETHSLALCSDGTVAAWGFNSFGQLGDNSTTDRHTPVAVNIDNGLSALPVKSVVAIAAGRFHSLALCSDGTVIAWGYNDSGQLGDNRSLQSQVPVAVNVTSGLSALSGKTATAIAAGGVHSLALCHDGSVAAWGHGGFGQLGNNSTSQSLVPVTVNAVPGTSALAGKNVVALAAGGFHSLALCSDGTVAAWGTSDQGQLGDNSSLDRLVPTAVDVAPGRSALAGKSVLAIATGWSHSMALGSDGRVAVWGSNGRGQLGNGTTSPRQAPVEVVSGTLSLSSMRVTALSVSADSFHSSAIYARRGPNNVILSTKRTQTVTFAPPATVYLGQSPLSLHAYSSSGLPVTLSVVPTGTTAAGAVIEGQALLFTGPGTVKVQAGQAGGGNYAAAPGVVKTITVKADPTVLTLVDLTQPYTGTPCSISTLGGSGMVTLEYKMGAAFGSTAPTNAGSYPVRATDSSGTKTGTLVITKAPLYVTPDDQRRFVGENNPALTLTYNGWLSYDSSTEVNPTPTLKTSATKTSPGGVYPITASGGAVLRNYTYIYQQGALQVDSFSGTYETLLENSSSGLYGKLAITVSAMDTSFTGKLSCKDEKSAVALSGPLRTTLGMGSASGSIMVTSGGIPYIVNFTALINGTLTATVTRQGISYTSDTGRRVSDSKPVLYGGAHTAVLEPATPAAAHVPAGAGWATAAISTKGVMTLAGRLGDGTSFTSTASPDDGSDPTYRLWLQPYKTGSATRLWSCLGGAVTLLTHPTLASRRYVEAADLTWAKAGLTTDESYRVGFGPVSTVLMIDPWLPPGAAKGVIPAVSLATRLDLTNSSFQVAHSDTGSTLNGNLPTHVSLGATNLVSVTTPSANTTKWKTVLVPATGLFSGSFELADTTPKPRVVPFSGVLRQPATNPDNLIGDGHYILPPLSGTEKTTGEIMFVRP